MRQSALKDEALQEFLLGLDKAAQASHSFIFNPRKLMHLKTTKWLEIGDKLSHTAWNCRRDRVRLTFYTASASQFERSQNEARLRRLMEFKNEIESKFGQALVWDLKPGRGDQFVDSLPTEAATAENRERWEFIQNELIERANQLYRVMRPYLDRLEEEERQALQTR